MPFDPNFNINNLQEDNAIRIRCEEHMAGVSGVFHWRFYLTEK